MITHELGEEAKQKVNSVIAYFNKGNLYQTQGRLRDAIAVYNKALHLKPDCIEVYSNMGIAYQNLGQLDKAILCFKRVQSLKPDYPIPYYNIGNIYQDQGKLKEAIDCYQEALTIMPDYLEAYCNMGIAYQKLGNIEKAIFTHKKALRIDPDHADTYNNIGIAYQAQGKFDEAILAYKHALQLKPNFAIAYNNMANVYKHQGKIEEAIIFFKKAFEVKPNFIESHSNYLMCMYYNPKYNSRDLLNEAKIWWQQYGVPCSNKFVYTNQLDLNKRLKIGYVSPDFRQHSVSFFFLPLCFEHNRDKFEIFCYSEVLRPDHITDHISNLSEHFISTVGMSDYALAKRINQDGIDILVDMAGHTANNRLPVFAYKPAPIQVSWLGYPGTTGMTSIDYRLTDAVADPEGESDKYYTEKLIRLTHGFLCYIPPADSPNVIDLSEKKSLGITFGSFNNLAKINKNVIFVWSAILKQVKGSCLLLKAKQLADESTRKYYLDLFNEYGISSEQIKMLPYISSMIEHLALYNEIDIALDSFPYNGTTTTCEALWMGAPVITLRGDRHSARVGASILGHIGLKELVTDTEEEYISCAIKLATDFQIRRKLKISMRQRLKESTLCNAKYFSEAVENTYRMIWNKWASKQFV